MTEIHGQFDPAFGKLKDKLERQIRSFGGGAAATVYLHGEKVVDIWGGKANQIGDPWKEETVALSYSSTKAVPITLVHILATKGLIDYDEKVAHYWPEFAQRRKDKITVRQILSHQSGLYQMRGLIDRPSDVLDWQGMIGALEKAEPLHRPGKANGYHALNIGWLLGALIEKVTGQTFKEVLRTELVDPLGLEGLIIGAEENELGKIAQTMGMPKINTEGSRIKDSYPVPSYLPKGILRNIVGKGLTPKRLFNYLGDPAFFRAEIPAMNGLFDARSLAKMYAMLANMGEFEGRRYIDPEIIEKAREVQTKRFDRVTGYPLHWRLGYHRADAIITNYPNAFGHYGLGGAGGWCHPEEGLAFALVHNSSPISALGQIRCIAITSAVYDGLKKL